MSVRSLGRIGGLVILGVVLLLATQFVWICHDPSISFSVENRLDEPIIVQLNGHSFRPLPIGERQSYATVKELGSYHLVVVDSAGTSLFDQTYTEEALDGADTIVIEDS